jgi:hypothetical protein
MTHFAAKILSPGAWAGKRRVVSIDGRALMIRDVRVMSIHLASGE